MSEMYNPPNPIDLLESLNDPIHTDVGNSRPVYTARMLRKKRYLFLIMVMFKCLMTKK